MNKKNIQLAVVVIAFLGMGIILYKGFFGGSGGGASAGSTSVFDIASLTPASILPYGNSFNYKAVDALQQQGFQYGAVQYPVLSTSTDVGKDVNSLITPLPSTTSGQ